MTRLISLSTSSFFEGQIGSKIGTLSCGDLTGTFEVLNWKTDAGDEYGFTIKGNDLYLAEGWMFDYEGNSVLNDAYGSYWYHSWGDSLTVKFTSSSGTVVQNTIAIDIKDVNDNVTITPNTVYKDVYGAVIGTLSANWNFFSQLTLGYNNSHTYFEIVGNKLKLKDKYYFDGTSVKDSSGTETTIANLGEIKLNVYGGKSEPNFDANHGDTVISVSDLASTYFTAGNVAEKATMPVISISTTEIKESISGVKIGTLSSGDKTGTFSLQTPNDALTIINDELYLTDGYLLDYETGKVVNNTSGSWVDESWTPNITINFQSNTFNGDTVKSVKHLIDNASQLVTNTIKLSVSSVKEGQSGIKIGTLSCGSLSGTYSLEATSSDWKNYFEIKGNDLYIKESYMFDYEKYSLISDTVGWYWYWGWGDNNLSIKFTPDDGSSIIENSISISISDLDESVTVSPEKVYQNVYGATIGTVSANWNDFTHAYMGYNNHTFFELSEEFSETFSVGHSTGLTASPWGASNVSATFINNYGSDLKLKWINREGVVQDPNTISTGTHSGWGLGDKDIFRLEDSSGNLISEIIGGGSKYIIDANGDVHKYLKNGNKLKLKDEYYFDGTSIKDSSGNSTAISELGDIKINVRGGMQPPEPNQTFVVNKSASTNANYSIDGQLDPTLTLYRGSTYTFEMSGSGHPFYLKSTSSTSGTSDQYTSGVVRNGSSGSSNDGDSLVFTVPTDAPDTLWYQCSSHSGMLGQLNILDNLRGDSVVTVSTLASSFFNSGNIDVASNEPTIKISNTGILEASPGVKVGTLSALGKTGTFSLTNSESYLTISGNDLKLNYGFVLDYESGKVFDGSSGSWDPSSPIAWNNSIGITLTEDNGTVTTGTITTSIVNLDETITISPVSLALNEFGGTVALLSTNSVQLSDIILGYQNTHDYFEIVGNKLKLKDAYSFDGSVLKDNSGGSHDIKQLAHVKLGINGGVTTLETSPTTSQETFTTTIFDLNETLSIEPKAFFSNHHGEAIASVTPNATNYFNQVTLSSDTFFEYTNGQLKLKSDYKFNGTKLKDKSGNEYDINNLNNLILTPSGSLVTSDATTSNVASISQDISPSTLKTEYLNQENSLESISNTFSTILGDGNKDNRIDVVILGDGYISNELNYTQPQHLYNLTSELFANTILEPFKTYKNYFNFHVIKVVSNESGVDIPSEGITVDTALNISRKEVGVYDDPTDDAVAIKAALSDGLNGTGISADQVVILVNTELGGGTASWYTGKPTVTQSGQPGMGATFAHEFGHSIGGLGDQYVWKELAVANGIGDGEIYVGSEPNAPDLSLNSSGPSGHKWERWWGYDDGVLGAIGAFEGGYYHDKGVYTPTPGSLMGSAGDVQNINQFDAIGKEAMVLGFYNYVTPLDDYSAKDYSKKIQISDATVLEGISGALLGDLSVGDIEGTFSLANPVDYLTISNDQLRLVDGYFIDKESNKVFTSTNNTWISSDWDNTITVNFDPTWKEYQLSETFTFTVDDLNESITLSYSPLSNISGANVANLSTNSIHLNEINLGYSNSHDYFEVVGNTLKFKSNYYFDGSVIKDSNNQTIQLSNIDDITLGTLTSASSANGNGNTSITASDLMTNFSNSSSSNTIKLSVSSVKEGQSGIKIGTLSCGSLSGTYSLEATSSDWKNYFEIKGNDLYIKESYMFDYEKYSLISDTVGWYWYWGWGDNNLSIKFTPDDGSSIIENSISISISDLDESVTVSPEKVYQNVYGATIGTVSANWNDFTHAYMGYNNHTFFELSEEFSETFSVGHSTGLTASPWGASNVSATFINNYGSDLKLKWINREGVVQDPNTISTGTHSGWGLGDKDIFRLEDSSGNLISEIIGGGSKYIIDANGDVHKYLKNGNKLKLKDEYYFDGTSIKDSSGNSTAISELGDIKINVRGGMQPPEPNQTFVVNKSASTNANYSIDGQLDPTLTLYRGSTYTFEMSGSGHPFYLKSTSSTSGTSDQYTSGVVRNGSSGSSNDGDSLVFTVPTDAPDTLWYQCSSHSGMLGQLNILDNLRGDSVVTVSTLASSFFNSGNTIVKDEIINPSVLILDAVDENLLTFEWKIDGTSQDETSSKFDISAAGLSDGTYKITAIAKDDSNLVRLDKSSMTQTVDWVIKIDSSDNSGTTFGTEANDVITTGSKNDNLFLGSGDDQITSGTGNDTINLGSGADVTYAGGNDDIINLYADSIWSSKNEAWNINSSKVIFSKINLNGKNKFHDVINGNTGSDTLNLTTGSDAFFLHDAFGDFNNTLSVSDDAYGKKNTDRLISIETINGGDGDDIVDLTSPNTSISTAMLINGESGSDVIWASAGDDTLNGGDGDDVLFGGSGVDTLTGGLGTDIFEFENLSGNDIINDYNLSEGDKLRFYLQDGDPNSLTTSGDTVTWGSITMTLNGTTSLNLTDILYEFINVEV